MDRPLIDQAVDRFLAWKLPEDFAPDCGITFTPLGHPNGHPIGTNLLTAIQAKAMLEYVLGDIQEQAARDERERLIALLLTDRFQVWLPEAGDLWPAQAGDLRKMFKP